MPNPTAISAGGAFVPKNSYDRTGAQDVGTYENKFTGQRKVLNGQGATVQLLPSQSGTVCQFDRAAGIVYTLPAPEVGLWFEFDYVTTITSNAATVQTNAATVFMSGSIIVIKTDGTLLGTAGNGTSHVKVSSNGTTTGGILGGTIRVRCVKPTVWLAEGLLQASGTIATPFA